MKNLKVKLCLIVALVATMIVTLGIFLGNIALASRYLTVSGTSIFVTSGDAAVWAHAVNTDGEGKEIEDWHDYYFYTMFTFKNDADTVTYRRNLAYNWYYNASDVNDAFEKPYRGTNGNWWIRDIDTGLAYNSSNECKVNDDGFWVIGETVTEITKYALPQSAEGYMRLELGFEEVNFEKFVISFETQQFNMTKDEKTTNYVIFLAAEPEGEVSKLYVLITDDKDVAEKDAADLLEEDITEGHVKLDIDHVVIQLGESEDGTKGDYAVTVSNAGNDETVQKGKFVNVGKMYAKYVSSSTKPVTPLTFKAEFAKDEDGNLAEGQTRARMAIYNLNGQSFVLNRDDNGDTATTSRSLSRHENPDGTIHYEGGQLNDNCPPVLCLDSGISYVKQNAELNFNYVAVDVLTQSPSTVTGFFMFTNDMLEKEGFNPDDYEAEGLFKTVTSEEDLYIFPHANHLIPVDSTHYNCDVDGTTYGAAFSGEEDSDLKPTAAVKIYLKLTDTTSTGGQSTYVFLDWFVENEYKLRIDGHDYLAVATDEKGATFNYGEGNSRFSKDNEVWKAYNEKVQEAAKDLRAGSDEDFYLPSVETLFVDNATAYEDMTFSIYYMVNGSTMSNTGRTSSRLFIDLATDGDYIFTVYATDAANNGMWYIDDEGELVEFAISDIWTMYDDKDDEGLRDILPWFSFTAGISDISVEAPGEQSTAYVGATYTAEAFEIEGISTKATYSLYCFNHDLYADDHDGKVITYQEFMDNKKELFEKNRNYFTYVKPQSELVEGTDEYDEFNAYAWNPSARSFVPQDANAFYLIKCDVTSARMPSREAVSEYMGIAISATPNPIKGEDTWVRDNMTSIILLSIAGAAFIGIILLIFIKPKNKGDIDVQFEEEEAKKNK